MMEEIVTAIPNPITSVIQPTTSVPFYCKICSGSARYCYYGAVVCHPCKMFFKRNAETKQVS